MLLRLRTLFYLIQIRTWESVRPDLAALDRLLYDSSMSRTQVRISSNSACITANASGSVWRVDFYLTFLVTSPQAHCKLAAYRGGMGGSVFRADLQSCVFHLRTLSSVLCYFGSSLMLRVQGDIVSTTALMARIGRYDRCHYIAFVGMTSNIVPTNDTNWCATKCTVSTNQVKVNQWASWKICWRGRTCIRKQILWRSSQ